MTNYSNLLHPPTLKPSLEFSQHLNFGPIAHWPVSLPGVAINGVIVAGFLQNLILDHQVPFTNEDAIAQIFTSLYPELSFMELLCLAKASESHKWFPIERVTTAYHQSYNDIFQKHVATIQDLPLAFRKWCIEKRMNQLDLAPLLAVNTKTVEPILLAISERGLTKSQGTQALELAVDLFMMGKTLESIMKPSSDWLEHLKQLRYPNTADRDQKAREALGQISWPNTAQVRWVRQGDRAGVELKVFFSSPNELEKKFAGLNQIQDLLEQNSEDLWTQH